MKVSYKEDETVFSLRIYEDDTPLMCISNLHDCLIAVAPITPLLFLEFAP